jgi:NAD(P)-dependent dehydrogenase (short-subunit alcohol dehydrogenase family)
MTDLRGKTIYVTGASRGIGRAIVLRVSRDGPHLGFCGRDTARLTEVEEKARELGAGKIWYSAFDLVDVEAVLSFYREARKRTGPPDILINNAGFNSRKARLWEYEQGEYEAMFAVNVRAPLLLMREAAPDFQKRGGGTILNVLSTVCHYDMEMMSVYTASKKALEGLTDIARKEMRPFGVRVMSIYPGGTDTDFRAESRPHYTRPESVAEAVYAALTLPEDLTVHKMTFRPMSESNF